MASGVSESEGARVVLVTAALLLAAAACSFSTSGVDSAGTSTSEGSSESSESEASEGATSDDATSEGGGTNGSTSAGTEGAALDPWRRKIGFLNAGASQPLRDFPVPIELTPAEIDALGDADGADLRFLDDDEQTVLAHEIERWDPERGAVIWVRVPEVAPGDDDLIWMYGGDLDAAPGEDPAGVWQDDYALVLHMSDDPGDGGAGASNAAADVAAAYRGGMDSTNQASGPVGGAFVFDGAADFLSVPAALATDDWAGLTVTAWVRHDDDDDDRIVCKSPSVTPDEHVFSLGVNLGDALRVRLATDGDGGTYGQYDSVEGALPQGAWTFTAFTWDGESDRLAIIVDQAVIREAVHGGDTLLDSPELVTVANVNDYDLAENNRLYTGGLDELRVSRVARADDWLAAQSRVMGGNMLVYGAIELL